MTHSSLHTCWPHARRWVSQFVVWLCRGDNAASENLGRIRRASEKVSFISRYSCLGDETSILSSSASARFFQCVVASGEAGHRLNQCVCHDVRWPFDLNIVSIVAQRCVAAVSQTVGAHSRKRD